MAKLVQFGDLFLVFKMLFIYISVQQTE